MTRGYFGIGIFMPKTEINVGTLWRSAFQLGASFTFVIGKRYKNQSSDTTKSTRHIPLFQFETYFDFTNSLYNCQIVCVEFSEKSVNLIDFKHPERCVYLLGAEDFGLPQDVVGNKKCVEIPSLRTQSYNVSVAGSIVMYDRFIKLNKGGE